MDFVPNCNDSSARLRKEERASRETGTCVTKTRREGMRLARETQAATRYLHPSDFCSERTEILDGEKKSVRLRSRR